jgi:hypothetical protein
MLHHTLTLHQPLLTPMIKEQIITDQIQSMLPIKRISRDEALLLESEFADFEAWCDCQGLRALPANAHIAAAYLIDLVHDGATLDKIADAAAAISYAHNRTREYLDWAPINAALDYAITNSTKG